MRGRPQDLVQKNRSNINGVTQSRLAVVHMGSTIINNNTRINCFMYSQLWTYLFHPCIIEPFSLIMKWSRTENKSHPREQLIPHDFMGKTETSTFIHKYKAVLQNSPYTEPKIKLKNIQPKVCRKKEKKINKELVGHSKKKKKKSRVVDLKLII